MVKIIFSLLLLVFTGCEQNWPGTPDTPCDSGTDTGAMTMPSTPGPQLVAYGYVPSGVTAGQFSPNTYGCVSVSGGNGLHNIQWPDGPSIQTGRLIATLTPLNTGPGGALTFGTTPVGGNELDVQVRRSDTNAVFDGAFSFKIELAPPK